ncbi:hypothetical protein PHYSODRAFT_323208 [Phytophthora sojae]|uniref:Uncharacterized protein n=1 Tax=Phytophthora sojae (strain P6497) TaxID=1094619 RepID=G4YJC4_PHYSP|nr:hypothetical protein PHYSODRAFT_323208 [Phytophthora sojae]EGZ29721.1 hypothetical protein PHYSODRAFT_323208 [Phytophthora sojae]|eukprot:XP_009516996.1 hypothetical protein PHYSODRAFT_323208 [Phytophthora sojae]
MSSPKKTAAAAEGETSAGTGTLSVPEYFERHGAKRDAPAAKAAAGTSSRRLRKESIDSDSLDPHAGSKRPREGDDSDASSSKRSRGESDTPFSAAGALSSPRDIADRVGNTVPPNEIPLYVCSCIHDDAVAEEQHFYPLTNQRRDYYIGLSHELRYFSSKKASSRSKVPDGLSMPVNASRRFRHVGSWSSSTDPLWTLVFHALCLPGAARLSDRDLNGYTTIRVPASLKDLRAKFLASAGCDARGTSGAAGNYSARTTFTPEHQSLEFTALKQEMAILRAQVALGSQTTSDISVNVGGRAASLVQRVHALEQRFAPAGLLLRARRARWLVLPVWLQPPDVKGWMEAHAR